MILVDTSVIIAYWRKPNLAQQSVFDKMSVAFCGVTRAELYVGAQNELQIEEYSNDLDLLHEIRIENSIWEYLGRNLRTLRSIGITVPFTDAVIATVALQHDFEVWTYDSHFQLIRKVLPKLRLFNEPASSP